MTRGMPKTVCVAGAGVLGTLGIAAIFGGILALAIWTENVGTPVVRAWETRVPWLVRWGVRLYTLVFLLGAWWHATRSSYAKCRAYWHPEQSQKGVPHV